MEKFSEEYIKEIQQVIDDKNEQKAKEYLKDLHPADIAELYQALNLDEAEFIYRLLDSEKAADVLMELDEDDRKKLLKRLPNEMIAKQFIDHLDTDDAVDLIRELDEEAQEEILSHISGEGLTLAVLGDHGHLNCRGKISLNGLFVRQGWAPDPLPGSMAQCRAFCHGAGVSAQVYVNDSSLRPELETLFEALREQGYLWNWYTREAVRQYGLDGPFDYVLEGGEEYFFTDEILPQFLTLTPAADGGCFVGRHGHFPLRGERPPFLLSSPGIESRTLSDHSILDIAPTLTELFHLPAFPMAGSSLLRL